MAHLVLTVYAVTATGNHWWLDSIAAIALLFAALWIDDNWLLALRTRSKPIGKISTS